MGCPDIDVLRDLIQGTLSEGDETAITEHLGDCPGCQYRFDQMAGPEEFVDRVPKMLGQSGEPTVLDAALDQLEAETSRGLPQYPGNPAQREHHTEQTVSAVVQDTDEFSPYGDVERWFDPSDDPEALGSLAGYDLIDFIGRGGMGVVFRGRDRTLGRDVAIKVLAPSLAANTTARERFFREARAAAAINHSNVATVHSVEESAQLPCLMMEYVDGESLRQRLDDVGRLELKELIRVGYQVASGLDAAHSKGIVHRDIKPGNILLESSSRRVRLTDFGLARVVTDDTLTQTGLLVGTPGYIAPEVATGDEADHRADLFSLGCLLYVMATGELPFQADSTMQSLRRVVDDEATPPRELNPSLPDWLNELITALMQKSPDDRPQTASEVKRIFKRKYRELKNGTVSASDDSGLQTFPALVEPDSLSADSVDRSGVLPALTSRSLPPIAFAGAGAALLAIALAIGAWLGGDDGAPQKRDIAALQDRSGPSSTGREPRSDGNGSAEVAHSPIVVPDNPAGENRVEVTPFDPLPDEDPDEENPEDDESDEFRPRGRQPDEGEHVVVDRDEPFAVETDGDVIGFFDALDDAVDEADDGHVIVIRSDGPFEAEYIGIRQHDLTITAAPGTHPVIQLVSDDDELSGELFEVFGSLNLRGLELRIEEGDDEDADDKDNDDEDNDLALVRSRGPVRAINCRFVQQRFGQCLIVEHTECVELINCELHAPRGHVVSWSIDERGELGVHNCILTAETAFFFDGVADEFHLELMESTVLGGSTMWLNLEYRESDKGERGLHVNAERTVFDVDDAHLVLEPDDGDARMLFAQTRWGGEQNIYTGPFAAIPEDDGLEVPDEIPRTITDWAGLKNVEEVRSILHAVEFERDSNELRQAAFDLLKGPTPFRLLEPRLRDLPGANVEEIGPGPPFEHWLREHAGEGFDD